MPGAVFPPSDHILCQATNHTLRHLSSQVAVPLARHRVLRSCCRGLGACNSWSRRLRHLSYELRYLRVRQSNPWRLSTDASREHVCRGKVEKVDPACISTKSNRLASAFCCAPLCSIPVQTPAS
eukprot:1764398-Rhodomonas_salina.2